MSRQGSDLILHRSQFTTLDRSDTAADATGAIRFLVSESKSFWGAFGCACWAV
jgi:hypothetical protein